MTSRQGQSIGWSSYNYPTSINAGSGGTAESVSLYYGPDRHRWHQHYTGNGATEDTYYVGDDLEVVTSGGVTNYRHYIYAGVNDPVAVYSRSSSGTSTVDYVLSDHQGSVAALTNASGGTVVSESFTPYGNRRNPTTWSGPANTTDLTTAAGITRQAYTFQTQLGLWMGMNHMNGRVQDSITGRFISPDPSVQDASNPQDYNLYSYTVNNPLTHTDPTGFAYTCMTIPLYNPIEMTPEDLIQSLIDGDDENPGAPLQSVTVTAPQLPTEYITQCSQPEFNIPAYTPPAAPPHIRINIGGSTAGRRGPQKRPQPCLDQRYADFFADQVPAAKPVAVQYNIPLVFLLTLSAYESGYGTGTPPSTYNAEYSVLYNPFGATPSGDSTQGLSYSSFAAAWSAWGNKWGPDVANVTDFKTFTSDLQKSGYNSLQAPGGNPNWESDLVSVEPSVSSRLNQFLNGVHTCH